MKRTVFALAIILCGLCLIGAECDGMSPSDKALNAKQEQIMQEANAQVGMPAITNFSERKMMKMILELRDQEGLVNYAYLFSEQTGQLHLLGKCIGYGLPYSTQYTSPQKKVYGDRDQGGNLAMPQADPNGLFMPASAEGTWLMLIGPDGTPHPCYIEPRVIVSPFELEAK